MLGFGYVDASAKLEDYCRRCLHDDGDKTHIAASFATVEEAPAESTDLMNLRCTWRNLQTEIFSGVAT